MTDDDVHEHPHEGPHWCWRANSGPLFLEEWTDPDEPAWRIMDAAPLDQVELAQGQGQAFWPIPAMTWQAFIGLLVNDERGIGWPDR